MFMSIGPIGFCQGYLEYMMATYTNVLGEDITGDVVEVADGVI